MLVNKRSWEGEKRRATPTLSNKGANSYPGAPRPLYAGFLNI